MSERVAELRNRAGLTRPKLAKLAGVSSEYIRKLEADEYVRPSLVYLNKVAAVLGVSAFDLTGEAGSDNTSRLVAQSAREVADVDIIATLARRHGLEPQDLLAWIEALEAMPPEVREYELQGAKLRARGAAGADKPARKKINDRRTELEPETEAMEG